MRSSVAAVTDYHKHTGLRQPRFTLSPFTRLEAQHGLTGMQARCGRAALLSGGSRGPCFRASPAARGTSTPCSGLLPPPSQLAAWHLCDLVSVITPLSLTLFSAIRGSVSPKAGPPLVEEPRWRLPRRVMDDTSRPRLWVFSSSHCSRGAVQGAGWGGHLSPVVPGDSQDVRGAVGEHDVKAKQESMCSVGELETSRTK